MFGPRTRSILACAALIGLAGCSAQPAGDTEAQAAPAASATASTGTAQPTSDAATHPLDRLPELPWDYDLQGALDGDIVKQLTPESDPEALVEALRTVVQLDWMMAERQLPFSHPDAETLRGLSRDIEYFMMPAWQAGALEKLQPNIDYATALESGTVPAQPAEEPSLPLYPGSRLGTSFSGLGDIAQDWHGYEDHVFMWFRGDDNDWEVVPVLPDARHKYEPTRVTAVYDAALHPQFNHLQGFVIEHENHLTVPLADGRTGSATFSRTTLLSEHAGRWLIDFYQWKPDEYTVE